MPYRSNPKGTWGEFGAGVSAEMTRGANLFLSGSYQAGFSQKVKTWDVRDGLRFNW